MFSSTIILTVGRPTVSRAVESMLNQSFRAADYEVIVVNYSGEPLPAFDWRRSERVRVINTIRRERSVARNSGAAIARGAYLHFLDDDDWLLPEAMGHFWALARRASDAAWLYGGIQVVDEAGVCLAEVNSGLSGNCFAQIMGGAWAPIQASIIKAATFFEVGGYNPAVMGTEDLDLCRRVALKGDFANTPAVVACLLRGPTWATSTNYLRAPEDTLLSRDSLLDEQGSFGRMLSSVDSGYWYGRMLRVYLSTVRYNLRQRKLFTAASRGIFGLMGFILAGKFIFAQDFWQAARADHPSETLHFIMKELEQKAGQDLGGAIARG